VLMDHEERWNMPGNAERDLPIKSHQSEAGACVSSAKERGARAKPRRRLRGSSPSSRRGQRKLSTQINYYVGHNSQNPGSYLSLPHINPHSSTVDKEQPPVRFKLAHWLPLFPGTIPTSPSRRAASRIRASSKAQSRCLFPTFITYHSTEF